MTEILHQGVQPFFSADDQAEISAGVRDILASGQLAHGHYVQAFEAAGADMAGTKHAIAVNSGGTALELALTALDIAGGEVLVPTNTFVASASSVVRAGGTPVFVDVDVSDLTVSLKSAAQKLTKRTRGLMLVHLFGLMSPRLPEIQRFCREHNLFLLEDAAHAHGAQAGQNRAGSLGIAGCFSYYATKILTCGEGGLITTDDAALADRLRSLRDHGRGRAGSDFTAVSNNFRLAEIPALIGVVQHRGLKENLAHRRAIAAIYREVLGESGDITLLDPEPREGHAYWRYAVLLDERVDRAALQQMMAEKYATRITWMYEPLCHQQPAFAAAGVTDQEMPAAVATLSRLVNLPTHQGIRREDARQIAEGLLTTVRARVAV
jgi:dTDP-4-amino-4,6-dideoxygalactose transaminase